MRFIQALAIALAAMVFSSPVFAHDFGPSVGDRVPAPIVAPDAAGIENSFDSLTGPRGLVLAFVRSADWCPYCQRQLVDLEGVRADIEAEGWKLAAVTIDAPDKLDRFARRRSVAFPLLSDQNSRLIRAFDLVDPNYPPGHRVHGVPVPTIYFITPDQRIVAKLGDADYRVRPAPDVVLATLRALGR